MLWPPQTVHDASGYQSGKLAILEDAPAFSSDMCSCRIWPLAKRADVTDRGRLALAPRCAIIHLVPYLPDRLSLFGPVLAHAGLTAALLRLEIQTMD